MMLITNSVHCTEFAFPLLCVIISIPVEDREDPEESDPARSLPKSSDHQKAKGSLSQFVSLIEVWQTFPFPRTYQLR